ncbi:MAG: HlyD family efflux transporter periplasmic adaptor subunit [Bacteroidales bacterium]|nr:HlyD family efflux transporter periplasmic adaptor subunit [Bacteroidales bacterium]
MSNDIDIIEDQNLSEDNLNLRSEEVQEILGRPPKWIVRVGISIIFVVVAGLFVGSYFLKYPDILPAPITVTTENLPAGVMAMTTGKIDTIAVAEKQTVKEGELLAVIRNPAKLEDVMAVKQMLEVADTVDVETCHGASLQNGASLQLGDLQSAYTAFDNALTDYRHFVETDYHNRKIAVIRKQIAAQKNLLQKTVNQLNISRKQLATAQKLFEIDSMLYSNAALSLVDYQSARNSLLQQLSSLESSKMSVDNQRMSILQSEQSIFDLEQQRIDEEQRLTSALTSAKEQLAAQIRQWEQTYLLVAPCDGKVTFTKYWQKNQNVNAGEVLVTVVPDGDTQVVGKILLPQQGAGKVKVGQTVNVKLDNFPYLEYGMVKVCIRNISMVPVQVDENTKAYMLEVEFPENLVTTYGRELTFSQEMTGTAEIITEDLRLLDKFINPIRAVIKK